MMDMITLHSVSLLGRNRRGPVAQLTVGARIGTCPKDGGPNVTRELTFRWRGGKTFPSVNTGGVHEQFDVLDFAIKCQYLAGEFSTASEIQQVGWYSTVVHWVMASTVGMVQFYAGSFKGRGQGPLKYLDIFFLNGDGSAEAFYLEVKPHRFERFAQELRELGDMIRNEYSELLAQSVDNQLDENS
jgi:hypothetical protein